MPHKKEKVVNTYDQDDGPLTEEQLAQLPVQPIQQFEIDWDKIAENVRAADLLIKTKPIVKQVEKPKKIKVSSKPKKNV